MDTNGLLLVTPSCALLSCNPARPFAKNKTPRKECPKRLSSQPNRSKQKAKTSANPQSINRLRILPQHLEIRTLSKRLPRHLDPLLIYNLQTPSTNRLKPLPSNMLNPPPTPPSPTHPILKFAPKLPTLLLKTPRTHPPSPIPPVRIFALAPTRFEAPVQLPNKRRRDAREAVVAVAVPALGELLR